MKSMPAGPIIFASCPRSSVQIWKKRPPGGDRLFCLHGEGVRSRFPQWPDAPRPPIPGIPPGKTHQPALPQRIRLFQGLILSWDSLVRSASAQTAGFIRRSPPKVFFSGRSGPAGKAPLPAAVRTPSVCPFLYGPFWYVMAEASAALSDIDVRKAKKVLVWKVILAALPSSEKVH